MVFQNANTWRLLVRKTPNKGLFIKNGKTCVKIILGFVIHSSLVCTSDDQTFFTEYSIKTKIFLLSQEL